MQRLPAMSYSHAAHRPLLPLNSQEFVKGFVASASLAALQGSPALSDKRQSRRVLRLALQGGTALGAADACAQAATHGDYTRALLSASLGVAGVYLIEKLLRDEAAPTPDAKEHHHG